MVYIISLIVAVTIGYKLGGIGKVKVIRCKDCYGRRHCQIHAQCMGGTNSYCSLGVEE